MNNSEKGFTLIELLAVIVIMGILMMVAIPATSKIIENSRKDTFIETAQVYTNAVRNLWDSDSLYCGDSNLSPSSLPVGNYYVLVDSTNKELVEQGGNSSWGNKDVKGYVKISLTQDFSGNIKKHFNVALTDGVHGIKEIENKNPNELNRNDVLLDIGKDERKLRSVNENIFRTGAANICGVDFGSSRKPFRVVFGDKNNLKLGDLIGINDEYFNVLSVNSSNNTVTMMAKYNLFVRGEYLGNETVVDYDGKRDHPLATGLQNHMMVGIKYGYPYRGVVRFGLTNQYSGSYAEGYVNQYADKLIAMGLPIVKGRDVRLITKKELEDLFGCDEVSKTCKLNETTYWLANTSFWTQTSSSSDVDHIWRYNNRHNSFKTSHRWSGSHRGIRPVVTLPISVLE